MTERSKYASMSNAEILAAMTEDTPIARARQALSGACGRLEQKAQQREFDIFEQRRLEFECVEKILAAYAGRTRSPQ